VKHTAWHQPGTRPCALAPQQATNTQHLPAALRPPGKHHGYSGSSDDKASARRYVVHAVNRVAEIFIAYSNGTLIPAAPGAPSTRLSLSAMMVVTGCPSVAQLVPGEPVSGRKYRRQLGLKLGPGCWQYFVAGS
jgi:hypothetical protein